MLRSIDAKLADESPSPEQREQLEYERAKNTRRGSRMVDDGADPRLVRHIAQGGTYDDYPPKRADWKGRPRGKLLGPQPSFGNDFLRDVRAARRGDADAFARLRGGGDSKGWTENTGGAGTSGGFLTSPDVLPGYLRSSARVLAAARAVRELRRHER